MALEMTLKHVSTWVFNIISISSYKKKLQARVEECQLHSSSVMTWKL